jgi:hypothetical protein
VKLDDSSDDDIIMDVKGKGKEVIRNPRPRSTTNTPLSVRSRYSSRRGPDPDLGTPSPTPHDHRYATAKTGGGSGWSPSIKIYDDSDDDVKLVSERPKKTYDNEDVFGANDSDPPDEFAEYIRKAQEREDKSKQEAAMAAQIAARDRATEAPAAASEEVFATIILISNMEGTGPLMARRPISKNLQVAIQTWVAIQQKKYNCAISEAEAARLFLTWNGRRIYHHTTIKSLPVQFDAEGKARQPADSDGSGYNNEGGLVFQVWNDELYAEFLQNKEKHSAMNLVEPDDDDDEDDEPVVEEVAAPGPQKLRFSLKAKDYPPFKMTAYLDTEIESIISVYRDQFSIPDEKSITLRMEGEELNPGDQINDLDDIDEDITNQIDVYIT